MKIIFTKEFEDSLRRMLWRQRLAPINPMEWYRQAKWFIQRGRRGYSDQDLWGAYHHIAVTVKAFCERYGDPENRMGYPMNLTDRKWTHRLKEIEWLMDEIIEDNTPIEVLKSARYQNRRKRAEQYFGEFWQNLWD